MQGAPRYNDSSLSALEPPALRAQELHLAHPHGHAVQDSKIRPGANINSETGSHRSSDKISKQEGCSLGACSPRTGGREKSESVARPPAEAPNLKKQERPPQSTSNLQQRWWPWPVALHCRDLAAGAFRGAP